MMIMEQVVNKASPFPFKPDYSNFKMCLGLSSSNQRIRQTN